MALETIRQQAATNNVASPVGVEVVAEKRGAYQGESVRSVGQSSKITTAHKSMGVQSALNTNILTLKQRSIKQGQGTNPQASARIAEWRDKLPQMPDEAVLTNLVGLMQQFSEELPAMLAHVAPHRAELQDFDEELANGSKQEPDEEEDGSGQFDAQGRGSQGNNPRRSVALAAGSSEGRGFQSRDEQSGLAEEAMNRIFAALEEVDADPTHQYAALDVVRAQFEAAGADERFLNLLDAAAAHFETGDLGREVRAGLAAAPIAAQVAHTLQTDPAAVRETYRDMLRGRRNLGQLFESLSTYDLSKNFESIVDTFVNAAGRDMASTGPSTDPAFLGHLLTELGQLKKMRTTFERCKGLIEQTERLLPARERGHATAKDVTGALLHFASAPAVGPRDARRLLCGIAKAGPEGQVVFANGLRTVHGDIPDEIIPSPQARLQQITALQSLQDDLVAREQAEFAAQPQADA